MDVKSPIVSQGQVASDLAKQSFCVLAYFSAGMYSSKAMIVHAVQGHYFSVRPC